jgi:hypothetical protein
LRLHDFVADIGKFNAVPFRDGGLFCAWGVEKFAGSFVPILVPIGVLLGCLAVAFEDAWLLGFGTWRLDPFQLDFELPVIAEVVGQLHFLAGFEWQRPDLDVIGCLASIRFPPSGRQLVRDKGMNTQNRRVVLWIYFDQRS